MAALAMAMNEDERVVFRDYPIWVWLLAAMTFVPTVAFLEKTSERILFGLPGALLIAFTSTLTVTVDHRRRMLNLHYRSPVRVATRTYPVSEICFVNVTEDNDGERMYRLELVLQSGEVVPLRSGYSAGKARKERRAQRLRSALKGVNPKSFLGA